VTIEKLHPLPRTKPAKDGGLSFCTMVFHGGDTLLQVMIRAAFVPAVIIEKPAVIQ